jgi:hypothetical protein
MLHPTRTRIALFAAVALAGVAPGAFAELQEVPLDVRTFSVLQRDSGPVNYYRTVQEGQERFIRGLYRPGLATTTLFAEAPEELHRGARFMHWRWRALVLPRGGNECQSDRGDSAANVYATWKRGLRWYSLKFVWSTTGPLGATCDSKRSPFVAQDSIVLRSGGPVGLWAEETVDLDALFRQHFENGNPKAEVPELAGVGILSDGDQTHSVSAADFAGFTFFKEVRGGNRVAQTSAGLSR